MAFWQIITYLKEQLVAFGKNLDEKPEYLFFKEGWESCMTG